jgi:aminopeptidase N
VTTRALLRALTATTLSAGLAATMLPTSAVETTAGSSRSGDSLFPSMGNGGYDVTHYDIDLSYRPRNDRIVATTAVHAVAKQGLTSFNLELRGLEITRITVDGAPVEHVRDRAELTVELPEAAPLPAGEPFTVVVEYAGQPHALTGGGLGGEGWITTPDGATVLSEPNGAMTWFPVNNTPRDKATYDISVDVPNRLKAASNGLLVGRDRGPRRTTWHWRETRPMAAYLATVSIGRYRMFRDTTASGVPLISFVDVKAGRAKRERRNLPKVMRFLEKRFGRYPFASSGMIIDNINVGYALETQGRPVYPHDAPAWLMVHELAHQWFGNSVTPRDWSDIWLNEGFASYAEWLWQAKVSQRKRQVEQEMFDFFYEVYGPKNHLWRITPGDPGVPRRLFHQAIYLRGAMTLHALRMEVGGRDFFRILRTWARRYEHGSGTTPQFKRLAEEVSGEQLDRLFRVWLYTPRKPRGY